MFDQYDPGFLPGLIGVIIGYTFRVVLQRITIVCGFPKQLESLQDHVTYHEKQKFPPCSDNWAFVRLDELLRNASEMVENGRNVPWFHVFSRYRMSKNMTKLISDIETHLKFWVAFNPICLAQPVEKMPVEEHVGSALRVATKEKMVAPLDAAVEMTTVLNQKSTLSVSSALRAKEETSEAAEKSRAAAGTALVGLSRNGGLSYRLISIAIKMILELNNIELTRKEQLTSLKAVVQELRKQLSSPRYNNGSAICRWLERFDRLLDNAYEMVERIKEARPDIFYRYRRGRKINRLLSEINAHLQLLPLAALGLIEESPHSMVEQPILFFDGASQSGLCAVGGVIYLNESHQFSFRLNCGMGTNMKAELIALWCMLKVANIFGLVNIKVYGDSRVTIKMAADDFKLNVLNLRHWALRAHSEISKLQGVHFEHIYREQNSLADKLSKQALSGIEGHLIWEEWFENNLQDGGSTYFFD